MKRTIFIKISVLLFLLVYPFCAFCSNVSWNGNWNALSDEGDIRFSAVINVDSVSAYNPYNSESLCNGFISITVKEPSGNESLLSTYELRLLDMTEERLNFEYTCGRAGIDEGAGKCIAVLDNGVLNFKVIENKDGSEVLFDGVGFRPENNVSAVEGVTSSEGGKTPIKDVIFSVLVILVYLFVLGHMIYVWVKGKRYKFQYTVDQMVNARIAEGRSKDMSEQEEQVVVDLLNNAYLVWSVVEPDEDGNEMRQPTKMKQIKKSCMFIDQALALRPTNQEIIERINELTNVINVNEERSFDGSKALVWLGGIVGVIASFLFGIGLGLTILVSTGAYVMASRTPYFLIEKRHKRGGGNIHNGILAGVFAMIAGAKTVRTVYTYEDGSKSYEDDNSQHWIALFFGFIVLLVIAFLMAFWALLNYLRNYVFYI